MYNTPVNGEPTEKGCTNIRSVLIEIERLTNVFTDQLLCTGRFVGVNYGDYGELPKEKTEVNSMKDDVRQILIATERNCKMLEILMKELGL